MTQNSTTWASYGAADRGSTCTYLLFLVLEYDDDSYENCETVSTHTRMQEQQQLQQQVRNYHHHYQIVEFVCPGTSPRNSTQALWWYRYLQIASFSSTSCNIIPRRIIRFGCPGDEDKMSLKCP
jgi:hypothetical protein